MSGAGRPRLAARTKYAIKWMGANLLHATGLLAVLLRARLRDRVVVLMYHRVLDTRGLATTWSHPAIVVSRDTFARQMRALRRYCPPVSLPDFDAFVAGSRRFDGPACLVTFDDGWLDTYTEAWPIMRAEQVPALVFLPSRFIDASNMFWREELGRLLYDAWQQSRHDADFASRATALLRAHGAERLLREPAATVRTAIIEWTQALRHQGSTPWPPVVEGLRGLLAAVPRTATSDAFMTWSQAREMQAAGVAFGAHSVTHRILTSLSPEEVEHEAVESRRALEAGLGTPITVFSYPNGNWNDRVAAAVAGAGFRLAFSTEPGPVAPGTGTLAIRRVNIHEDVTRSLPMFLARVAGVM